MRNVTKSNNSNISFFNQYYGSVLEDAKSMSFKLTDMEPMTLSEISEKVEGRYNFTACIKWTEQEKTIDLKNKDNTTTKKRLREGVVADKSESFIPISIWEKHIDVIEEGKCYYFENISIRQYFIKKLSSTTATVISQSDQIEPTTINWTGIDMTNFGKAEAHAKAIVSPTLCCPEILSVSITIFPVCSNPSCNKKLEVPIGEKFVSCNSCQRRLLVQRLGAGFVGEIDVSSGNAQLTLTVFPEVLNSFFGKEDIVSELFHKPEKLEEEMLVLHHVDITYTASKMVISQMKVHETTEDELD